MSWTCQRRAGGIKCGHVNASRKRNCQACGKPRPVRRRPKHMAALDLAYEAYIEINGGESCGICGARPSPGRRLDRDHEHLGTGRARGLLCHACNRTLSRRVTPEWLRAAAAYLERTQGTIKT
jgi:hypothetical protein